MPAGLLPDGRPHSSDEWDNAARISGVRPRSAGEADAVVVAYMRQQTMLRAAAGIPRARRGASGKAEDSAEALAAIERLHEQERRRRGLA
jgi:hypothetical protein